MIAWKPFLSAVAGIVVGLLLYVMIVHLWQDHAAIHELAQIETARQRAAQQRQTPPTPGTP